MCREVEVKSCLLRLLVDGGKWLSVHLDLGNIPVLIGHKAGWAECTCSVNTRKNIDARLSAIETPIFKSSNA
jgi:hypothetical protein